jgi:alkylation response protein AidB-like acyl-CoA dehydrogenase
MQFLHDPAINAFREEVRAFVRAELPEDIRRKVILGLELVKDDYVRWQKLLHRKGWIVGHWPAHLGGCDWSPVQRYIFEDETTRAGAPWLTPFGVNYVGPVLYTYGNAAQQALHLPGIRSTDVWWCQGYSEPDAGSDLVAMTTRAERVGDHYRVNGRKIWTTMAQWADMMFCLARTGRDGRPQEGVSFLLIDMHAPGVTVRPIVTLEHCHHLNEVLLEDVMVPASHLVGEEGKGWTYAKFLLGNERVLVAEMGKVRRMLAQARSLAAGIQEGGQCLLDNPRFADSLARCEIDARALDALCLAQLGAQQAGATPGAEASMLKIRGSELQQSISRLTVDALARRGLPYSTGTVLSDAAEAADVPEGASGMLREYLYLRAATIYGGSNEIQRNILAKSLLDT